MMLSCVAVAHTSPHLHSHPYSSPLPSLAEKIGASWKPARGTLACRRGVHASPSRLSTFSRPSDRFSSRRFQGSRATTPVPPPQCAGAAAAADVGGGSAAQEMELGLLIHYYREGVDYNGWGLHVWGDVSRPTEWAWPLQPQAGWRDEVPAGEEEVFGVQWVVPGRAVQDPVTGRWRATVNVLPHKGEEKDCTWTIHWEGADLAQGTEVWLVEGRGSEVFKARPALSELPKGSLDTARAMWLGTDVLAVPWGDLLTQLQQKYGEGAPTLQLHVSASASLSLTAWAVAGADASYDLSVDPLGLPQGLREQFPHLAHYSALRLPPGAPVESLVKGRLAVSCAAGGRVQDATEVQVTGVLDSRFLLSGPLGVHVEGPEACITLWAPTAQSVQLLLFDQPHESPPVRTIPLEQGQHGEWTARGPAHAWLGLWYQYEVLVYHPQTRRVERSVATDPYSRGLSANGERSLVIDLVNAEAIQILTSKGHTLEPPSWAELHLEKPALESFADVSLYELHIRDFSAADDTVAPARKGTYLAFTEESSNGVKHLKGLSEAGLTHVHLLPSFDFASVNEDRSKWKTVDEEVLRQLPPDSEEQQAAVAAIADEDAFNWGYDPVHWGVPDGSYTTNPDGAARTHEYRAMVQALNRAGLRVVVDVVYNHLHASGPHDPHSVLDKVVPGYYLRRAPDGRVEGSTCCNNTASEHLMVERLIVDDMVAWARLYKVDGFRFDLMGHLMKRTLMRARHALDALTVEKDGVDGRAIYMYGEGWDFGEVQNNGRGVNGAQANLGNTGIGSFNDRFRDSMLGGSPFGDPQQQGLLTGLYLQPNAWETAQAGARHPNTLGVNGAAESPGPNRGGGEEKPWERDWREQVQRQQDWAQLGLSGNLADYELTEHATGMPVRGGDVRTIDGTSVAYAAQPFETINYVSAHDNETLFDIVNIKASDAASGKDRMRMCKLALSMLALSQGVPFFHAGDEMYRSKSLDRDSYNSGDWFNRLDFSYADNNFGVGLPGRGKNGDKWDLMRPLLRNASLAPTREDILESVQHFRHFLRVRYSSPLFRLRTAAQVQERLSFLSPSSDSDVPLGIVALRIVDGGPGTELEQLDEQFKSVVVFFSMRPDGCSVSVPSLAGTTLVPHPLVEGILGCGGTTSGQFLVPSRSVLVFVENRG